MITEQVNIRDIKKNPKNPRVIRDSKFEKLKKSIQEFPEMLRSISVFTDEELQIIMDNLNGKLERSTEGSV